MLIICFETCLFIEKILKYMIDCTENLSFIGFLRMVIDSILVN